MDNVINYQVEMLNVGAADCFLIYYTYQEWPQKLDRLILVDGGNYCDGDKIMNHIKTYYPNKKYVDLAIVTHPDDDHIGGLVKMLEAIRDSDKNAIKINDFWVNDPAKHGYNPIDVDNDVKKSTLVKRLRSSYNVGEDSNKNLLALIDRLYIHREEVFAGNHHVNMPLYVLGPTKEYYTSLIPDFRGINLNFKDASYPDINTNYTETDDKETDDSLSPTLDNIEDDMSAPNRSSIIFTFMPNTNTKYLFTGDASCESFGKIPSELSKFYHNITWLKVPHHGSAHNLNTTLIKSINPRFAYISSEKEGHYTDRCTWLALKRNGTEVYSTHRDHADFLKNGFDGRTGYYPAQPL
jgi:beta-lactamase superfamily II metal-dependent hydrolase